MAFDRTDPADLAALKAEVENNPGHYPTPGNTQTVLDALNIPAQARTAATGTPPLSIGELWDIVAADAATATQFEFNVSNLFAMSSGPDTDVSAYRAGVIGLGDNQVNIAINAMSRDLNMAEQLFGGVDANGSAEFVTISRDDWLTARDS